MLDVTVGSHLRLYCLITGSLSVAGSGSAQLTKLPEQMVNPRGMISVPFIGDIAVAGKTPFRFRKIFVAV